MNMFPKDKNHSLKRVKYIPILNMTASGEHRHTTTMLSSVLIKMLCKTVELC